VIDPAQVSLQVIQAEVGKQGVGEVATLLQVGELARRVVQFLASLR